MKSVVGRSSLVIGRMSEEAWDNDTLGTLNVQLTPEEAAQIDAASDWKQNE